MKSSIKFVYLKILAVSVGLLSIFSTACVFGDTKPKIEYNISYRTSVGVYCTMHDEDLHRTDHIQGSFSKDYTVDVTDPTVTADINRCVNKFIPQIYSHNGFRSAVSEPDFTDGKLRDLTDNEVRIFSNFFGLPENFKGEKVVVKENIPFTFVGDGNGGLSYTVKPQGNTEVTKLVLVPPVYNHKVEEMLRYDFQAAYHPKGMPPNNFQYFRTDNLQEMLDHLEENAHPDYKVNISATVNYSYHVIGTASYKYNLYVTYLDSDSENISQTSSNQSTALKDESNISSDKPSSSANSSTVSDSPSSSEISSDTSFQNSSTATETDTSSDTATTDESIIENSVPTKKEDKIADKSILPLKIIILISLITIAGMVGYFCTVLLKKPKNK